MSSSRVVCVLVAVATPLDVHAAFPVNVLMRYRAGAGGARRGLDADADDVGRRDSYFCATLWA